MRRVLGRPGVRPRVLRTALAACLVAGALAGCSVTRPVEWAPDGSRIAVALGGQLYLVAPDGSGVSRVTRGSVVAGGPDEADVTWSPDGSRVAYTRGDEIVIVEVASGAELALADGSHPKWSPDGRWIAYTRGRSSNEASSADVWIADPDRVREPRKLGTVAAETSDGVDWAPDGTRLAACSNDGLVVFDVVRGSRETITSRECSGSPDWSSDGRLVMAAESGLVVFTPGSNAGIQLTTRSEMSYPFDDADPSWTPDGRRVAFTHGNGVGVVDVETGVITEVGPSEGQHPVWSPDGRTLAIVTWDDPDTAVHFIGDGEPATVTTVAPHLRDQRVHRGDTAVLALPRGAAPAGTALVALARPLPAPIGLGEVALDEDGRPSVTFTVPDLPSDRYELYLGGMDSAAWVGEMLVQPGGGITMGILLIGGWLVAFVVLMTPSVRTGIWRRRGRVMVAGSALLVLGTVWAVFAYPALLLLGAAFGSGSMRDARVEEHGYRGYALAAVGAYVACGLVCLGIVAGPDPKPSGTFMDLTWSPFASAMLGLVLLLTGTSWHAAHALARRRGDGRLEVVLLAVALASLITLLVGSAHAGALLWPAEVVAFAAATALHGLTPGAAPPLSLSGRSPRQPNAGSRRQTDPIQPTAISVDLSTDGPPSRRLP